MAVPSNTKYGVARFQPATRTHEGILCIHAFKVDGDAQGQIQALSEEKGTLQSALADVRGKLKLSELDVREWKREAETARAAVKSAELQLENAMKEHSATQAALIQVLTLASFKCNHSTLA